MAWVHIPSKVLLVFFFTFFFPFQEILLQELGNLQSQFGFAKTPPSAFCHNVTQLTLHFLLPPLSPQTDPQTHLRPGPSVPLGQAGLGLAGLNLRWRDGGAEGLGHQLLPLVGDLPQAAQRPRLLTSSAGAAAGSPFSCRPTVESKQKRDFERLIKMKSTCVQWISKRLRYINTVGIEQLCSSGVCIHLKINLGTHTHTHTRLGRATQKEHSTC